MNAQMRTAAGRHHIGTPCVVEQCQREGATAVLARTVLYYRSWRSRISSGLDCGWLALALIFWHGANSAQPNPTFWHTIALEYDPYSAGL
jgi:hypothetical protein